MYDVGQGNNIKDKPHVFEIAFADTIADTNYPCGYSAIDKNDVPVQYPLGYFDNETKEEYVDTTQHTNAGEPSDMLLLVISVVVALIAIWFLVVKKL